MNSIYPIPSKKLFKLDGYYKNKYGRINYLADTVIINDELYKFYKKGSLIEIGKMRDHKPTGYWFIYTNSLDLEYILYYGVNKTDSFYHPFAIVNQRW